MLLGHVLGCNRAGVLARLGEAMPQAELDRLGRLLDRRVQERTPLQYLIGRTSFLDFELSVGPGVFIPRPETELLVERALELWQPGHRWALDVCTGSGAIAIALARARPDARVLATDISSTALRAAAANARELGVVDRIHFVRTDLLSCLRAGRSWPDAPGVLVCNPPYAPRADVTQPEVRDHEPEIAWAAGQRGTEVYARLIPAATRLLPAGRPLVLEIGWGQEDAVPEILAAEGGWSDPRLDTDFQDIPRILSTVRS